MSDHPAGQPGSPILRWALWGVAAFGVAAVVYIIAQVLIQPGQAGALKSLAKGEMAKLTIPLEAGATPANTFYDAGGKAVRLADFKGKVVVLNIWATWCAPCVEEMPTLARLKAAYVGKPVEVIALSIDSPSSQDKARAFIEKHVPLAFYGDPKMKFPFALKPTAPGAPTTIIYGRDGVERARLQGAADWSGPDARAVVDAVLAEN